VLPNVTPTQIAERLHLDPIEGANMMQYDWLPMVKALWVFDALWFQGCGIRKKWNGGVLAGQAGSSASGSAIGRPNSFEWVVTLGAGTETVEITSDYEPPLTRDDWIDIRKRAVDRTTLLRWTAEWPKVPADSSIEQMGRGVSLQKSNPQRAINFLEVTAQQLIYWPKTRAQGLEILTGNNLRGFIEACGKTDFNLHAMVSLAAMQTPGEEPEESYEDGEATAEGP